MSTVSVSSSEEDDPAASSSEFSWLGRDSTGSSSYSDCAAADSVSDADSGTQSRSESLDSDRVSESES